MLEQFPQALKESRRWVCFNAAKTPINPPPGRMQSPTTPPHGARWKRHRPQSPALVCAASGCFWAMAVRHRHRPLPGPGTGVLSDMAREIIDGMQTYAEESPSGTGVHLLFTGQKPAGACRKSSIGLEMYDGGRYFTVTGKALNDLAIEERTAQCAAVHAKYLAKQETPRVPAPAGVWQKVDRSDEELLRTACAARDGERFAALYAGNWQAYYNSHSEADLSFCNLLAFWFGADAERMDHVFRTSGSCAPSG